MTCTLLWRKDSEIVLSFSCYFNYRSCTKIKQEPGKENQSLIVLFRTLTLLSHFSCPSIPSLAQPSSASIFALAPVYVWPKCRKALRTGMLAMQAMISQNWFFLLVISDISFLNSCYIHENVVRDYLTWQWQRVCVTHDQRKTLYCDARKRSSEEFSGDGIFAREEYWRGIYGRLNKMG